LKAVWSDTGPTYGDDVDPDDLDPDSDRGDNPAAGEGVQR